MAAGAALLLVLGLGRDAASPPRAGAERGVRLALIRLNGFLARRDMALLDEFAKGDDTLLVGSAPGETARGRAELQAHFAGIFARPETLSFSWRRVEVSVHGRVAFLYAEGDVVIHGDAGDRREPYRLSGVLELHGGRWLWRQFHGSQPVS
jgi:ketosteroid isomerase-like protein